MKDILEFKGEFRFLSNFHPALIIGFKNTIWPSVEHAYQAAKTLDPVWQEKIRLEPKTGNTKKLGRKCPIREDWDSIKISVMEELLRLKFKNPVLGKKLLATENALLVEGNWWNDTFWGVCKGIGENHLGKLLMKIREEIR